MAQAIINLTKEDDEKVMSYSKFWKLSKHETILRMIREFEGDLIIEKPEEPKSKSNIEKELKNLKIQMEQLFLIKDEHFKLEVLKRLESLRKSVNQLGSILSEQED